MFFGCLEESLSLDVKMNDKTDTISETLTSVVLTATSGDFPSLTIVAESTTTQTQQTETKTFFTQKNYWY